MNLNFDDRCDTCGRFVNQSGPGVSWCQTWSYDRDGTPDLHDPTYRCSACTDRLGVKPTNCHGNYSGRNPPEPARSPIGASPAEQSGRPREAIENLPPQDTGDTR